MPTCEVHRRQAFPPPGDAGPHGQRPRRDARTGTSRPPRAADFVTRLEAEADFPPPGPAQTTLHAKAAPGGGRRGPSEEPT